MTHPTERKVTDTERLDWLIENAYSGFADELREPYAVGLVLGGKVEWPEGIRAAIDAEIERLAP